MRRVLQLLLCSLVAACTDTNDWRSAEWLPATSSSQSLFMVEHGGFVGKFPRQGLSHWHLTNKPQVAALVGDWLVSLSDGSEESCPALEAIRPAGGSAQPIKLPSAFDRLSTSGEFGLAYNAERFRSVRRGAPGDMLLFRAGDAELKPYYLGSHMQAPKALASEVAACSEAPTRVPLNNDDFPVVVHWSLAGATKLVLVGKPYALQALLLSSEGEAVEAAVEVDLSGQADGKAFVLAAMHEDARDDETHVYLRGVDSALVYHCTFRVEVASDGRRLIFDLEQMNHAKPVLALAPFGAANEPVCPCVAALVDDGSSSSLEIRSVSPRYRRAEPLTLALASRYSAFVETQRGPLSTRSLVMTGRGDPSSVAIVSGALLLEGEQSASRALREVSLSGEVGHAVALENDDIWLLLRGGGATLIELSNGDVHNLPFTQQVSSDLAPRLGKWLPPDATEASDVIWTLSPDRRSANALITSTRQILSAALPAPAEQLVPLASGAAHHAVAVHQSADGRLSELTLAVGERDPNRSMGLRLEEHRHVFIRDMEAVP